MQVLRCIGIRKLLDGVCVLTDVELHFPRSGLVAIIGPNGAGKTTLLNILTGFVRADAGRCFLGEVETTHLPPYRVAALGIARTFQDLRLILRLSVLDNVLLTYPNQRGETLHGAFLNRGVTAEEARNRESALQILGRVGLQAKVQDPAASLSYGEQKLLSLACCLGTGAGIMLLDEPVAGVHPEMGFRILDLLRSLRDEGKLIVFIEHDIGAVRRIADYVIVMDEGKVIAQGSPSEVLERREIVEAYLD